jgi:hypothetical protein
MMCRNYFRSKVGNDSLFYKDFPLSYEILIESEYLLHHNTLLVLIVLLRVKHLCWRAYTRMFPQGPSTVRMPFIEMHSPYPRTFVSIPDNTPSPVALIK